MEAEIWKPWMLKLAGANILIGSRSLSMGKDKIVHKVRITNCLCVFRMQQETAFAAWIIPTVRGWIEDGRGGSLICLRLILAVEHSQHWRVLFGHLRIYILILPRLRSSTRARQRRIGFAWVCIRLQTDFGCLLPGGSPPLVPRATPAYDHIIHGNCATAGASQMVLFPLVHLDLALEFAETEVWKLDFCWYR